MNYNSLSIGIPIGIAIGALLVLSYLTWIKSEQLIAQGQCSVYVMNTGVPEENALTVCSDKVFRQTIINQPHEVDIPEHQPASDV